MEQVEGVVEGDVDSPPSELSELLAEAGVHVQGHASEEDMAAAAAEVEAEGMLGAEWI